MSSRLKQAVWWVACLVVATAIYMLVSGCSTVGRIKTTASKVFAVKDAGAPATLDENHEVEVLPLPAGTRAVMTSIEPTAGVPATDTTPAIAPQPGRTMTEFVFEKPTEWRKTGTYINAQTGTVDTTIAKHRIDAAENRFLLWASLGALGAAGVFMYLKYPTPALMCGAASAILFMAWKLAGLPPWFHVIGFCAVAGAIFLHRGYERREKEEKERAEELAKAKAIAVVPPPTPVVVVPVQPTPVP